MNKIKTAPLSYKTTALAAGIALTTGLSGCSSISDHPYEPQDPLQTVNRASFEFNQQFDRFLLKPIAKGYKWVTPSPVRDSVNNFYWNLDEIPTTINNVLQFQPKATAVSFGRLAINSTFGILGIFDVASHLGLQRRSNDFGITLAKYGFTGSPYLVIPFLGPSNIRDGLGLGVDFKFFTVYPYIQSVQLRNILLGVDYVRIRANYLGNEDVMNVASLDKYTLLRNAYIQRRQLQLQQHGTTWDQAQYYNVSDEELDPDSDWAMDGSLITEPPLKPGETEKEVKSAEDKNLAATEAEQKQSVDTAVR